MELQEFERKFLTDLGDESRVLKSDMRAESRAKIESLVDRGYCRLTPAVCGPLAIRTGEVMISVTEAGRAALESKP